ncbi:tRNA pseudouridine(13) synthase TruD [Eubacterium sp. AF36-5BH]|uniref:tRNA pseudouridine(13) synthase TruD n=1 Tax=Eubacterium sp. AF36-5BH TaxID=2293108 RepID=UPI001314FD54|nr:tRNA pseudouridine(13) synthase TruD [Eubacterium sp. AF36-5BH]
MKIKMKSIPEDFIVNESQALLISSSKKNMKYVIMSVGKKGYTTFEAISELANFWVIDSNKLGYAGLKDEDGVTYQMISMPIECDIQNKIEEFNSKYSGRERFITIVRMGYFDGPIRIGQLQGNSFKIRLRNVSEKTATKMKAKLRRRVFFPNYYDTQRFGIPNMPKRTHLIGEALYNNKYDLAMQYMKEGTPNDCKNAHEFEDSQSFFVGMDKNKLSFYYNAFISKMYNNYLGDYIKKNMQCYEKIYDGISYVMPQSGECLANVDRDYEKVCVPRYDVDSNMELSLRYFYRYAFIDTIIHVGNVEEDSLNEGKYAVNIDFFLPSGCYATMAVKQFLCEVEYERCMK